jgi:hypothetical protein
VSRVKRCDEHPEIDTSLEAQYDVRRGEGEKTDGAALQGVEGASPDLGRGAWVLACVFIRFLEENEPVEIELRMESFFDFLSTLEFGLRLLNLWNARESF